MKARQPAQQSTVMRLTLRAQNSVKWKNMSKRPCRHPHQAMSSFVICRPTSARLQEAPDNGFRFPTVTLS